MDVMMWLEANVDHPMGVLDENLNIFKQVYPPPDYFNDANAANRLLGKMLEKGHHTFIRIDPSVDGFPVKYTYVVQMGPHSASHAVLSVAITMAVLKAHGITVNLDERPSEGPQREIKGG